MHNVCFSLDGLEVKHFAYESVFFPEKEPIYSSVVVDGQGENLYDLVFFAGPESRPNYIIGGQPIRYIGSRNQGKNWFLVENGEETPLPYEPISSVGYSSDGKHFAFSATKEGKQFLVIDGKEKETSFDNLHSTLNFSPDGEHFAYVAFKENNKATIGDNQQFIVLDDKIVSSYTEPQHVDSTSFVFSPDHKHFSLEGHETVSHFMILDQNVFKPDEVCKYCDLWWGPIFTSDSEHILYVAGDSDHKEYVIQDKKVISKNSYWDISWLIISPDGKQIAYVGKHSPGEKEVLVINDVEQPLTYDEISSLAFSPDSTHLFFLAKKGDKVLVVEDNNKEGKIYDKIYPFFRPFYFSPDSKYIGYGAMLGNELWWIIDEIK